MSQKIVSVLVNVFIVAFILTWTFFVIKKLYKNHKELKSLNIPAKCYGCSKAKDCAKKSLCRANNSNS